MRKRHGPFTRSWYTVRQVSTTCSLLISCTTTDLLDKCDVVTFQQHSSKILSILRLHLNFLGCVRSRLQEPAGGSWQLWRSGDESRTDFGLADKVSSISSVGILTSCTIIILRCDGTSHQNVRRRSIFRLMLVTWFSLAKRSGLLL